MSEICKECGGTTGHETINHFCCECDPDEKEIKRLEAENARLRKALLKAEGEREFLEKRCKSLRIERMDVTKELCGTLDRLTALQTAVEKVATPPNGIRAQAVTDGDMIRMRLAKALTASQQGGE